MTEPAEVVKGAPFVVLGGKNWPISRPVWKQLRLIRDPIYDLSDAIEDKSGKVSETRYKELSPEQYDQMAMVVRVALSRTHPMLTEDEFGELEIGEWELLNAFLTVRLQTGQYVAVHLQLRPRNHTNRPLFRPDAGVLGRCPNHPAVCRTRRGTCREPAARVFSGGVFSCPRLVATAGSYGRARR
jgi:hypothetical protein